MEDEDKMNAKEEIYYCCLKCQTIQTIKPPMTCDYCNNEFIKLIPITALDEQAKEIFEKIGLKFITKRTLIELRREYGIKE